MGGGQRGKRIGRVDRWQKAIEINPRLCFVFRLCKDLGIDDPVHWMNTTSPAVVDQWQAFYSYTAEQEMKAMEEVESGRSGSGAAPQAFGAVLKAKTELHKAQF